MAGSTFQTPIHLDPNQDSAQQTAFINQNFQNIATALESNSFRIVQKGTISSPALSIAAPGLNYSSKDATSSVAHNLGYSPAIIAFIFTGTTYAPLPYYSPRGTNTANATAWPFLQVFVDNTNVYLEYSVTVYNQAWTASAGDYTVAYYLLQETAN